MVWHSISEVKDFLSFTKKQMAPALQKSTREWIEEEMPKRFDYGNTLKYGYTPNTPKYEAQKLRQFGRLPQLVRSGYLKSRVVNGVTVSRFGITLRYPRYGKYQRDLGRDFTRMTARDIKKIKSRASIIMKKNMKRKK